MRCTRCRRNDYLYHRRAEHVIAGYAEHGLRRAIEAEHHALMIYRNDGVERDIKDGGCLQRVAASLFCRATLLPFIITDHSAKRDFC